MKYFLSILIIIVFAGCNEEILITESLQGDFLIKKPQNSFNQGYNVSLGVKDKEGEFKELVMDVSSEVFIKNEYAVLIGLKPVENNRTIKRIYICHSKKLTKLDITDLVTTGYRGRFNFKKQKVIKELFLDDDGKFIIKYDGKSKRDFPKIEAEWPTLIKLFNNPKSSASK